MERFLSQCANYIYEKHKGELDELCLVFPNRRSGVFFTSYLQKQITTPVIGPQITTVNELIGGYSQLQSAEKLQLVSILYDIFRKHTQTSETFDEFYFWGEILLTDFNDIDRYLVNAKDLFTNISDLKEIDSVFDYLTDEQKKALEQFWGSMAVADKKGFQEKYIKIWDKLYPVYVDFKKELESKKLAYPGMADRLVAENLEGKDFSFKYKKYYIIGLNALNACEKKFFTHLQQMQKAEFLWDYDKFYLEDKNNEAGWFLRDNLKQFPAPGDFELNTEIFRRNKNVKLVSVSSVFGQSQQVPVFLEETKPDFKQEFDNTAIVLADESLLFSALGAIPESIDKVNVTMGYGVRNSVVYGFLMLLVNLLKNRREEGSGFVAYHKYVTDILNHQLLGSAGTDISKKFVAGLKQNNRVTVSLTEIDFSPLHKLIFTLPEKVDDYSGYFLQVLGVFYQQFNSLETDNKMLTELIYSVYQAIEKLGSVVESVAKSQNQHINEAVYFRLFSQYLRQVSVAFEGEPLSGLQVMGILETRCLDFQNLVILGLNENKWPRKFTAPSFIPYNIRKGFGLPGIDEQDAMYGYYFYRLIQRAKNVTATYSVVKEGIGTGELSRYGYQLQYDSAHNPEMVNLEYVFANDPVEAIQVKSSQTIVNKLLENNSEEHPLSPSAINTYIHCSLKFYFRYVVKLPESEEIKEEIDGVIFGNIFHDTLEVLYKPFSGKVINKTDIENILKDKVMLVNEITKQIAVHYLKKKKPIKDPVKPQGKTVLIFENILTYLKQLLRVDIANAPFTVESLEVQYKSRLKTDINGKKNSICIGGKIDRVDRVEGVTRVLDYKTGNVESQSFKQVDELFERDAKKPKKEILQALIYSWALGETTSETDIQPAIYGLRNLFSDKFSPDITWNKNKVLFEDVKDEFIGQLEGLVSEIFSEQNIFKQTEHQDKCRYCPYSNICRRF
ncbi:MAG: PD-(D/E)XK nuclease family protein [Bacteroidota bacterium]